MSTGNAATVSARQMIRIASSSCLINVATPVLVLSNLCETTSQLSNAICRQAMHKRLRGSSSFNFEGTQWLHPPAEVGTSIIPLGNRYYSGLSSSLGGIPFYLEFPFVSTARCLAD